jgi:hypothetical protein
LTQISRKTAIAFDPPQSRFQGPRIVTFSTPTAARNLLFTPLGNQEETMQRTVRYSAIAAITWLLSVAILISAVHFNVAQAQSKKGRAVAVACGKELIKQCSGVPVQANNMLECLQKNQEKLPKRCVALANNIVRMCDRDAAQLCGGVVASSGNILGCLTTAKRSVSSRCNAALDAAFVRQ